MDSDIERVHCRNDANRASSPGRARGPQSTCKSCAARACPTSGWAKHNQACNAHKSGFRLQVCTRGMRDRPWPERGSSCSPMDYRWRSANVRWHWRACLGATSRHRLQEVLPFRSRSRKRRQGWFAFRVSCRRCRAGSPLQECCSQIRRGISPARMRHGTGLQRCCGRGRRFETGPPSAV